MLRLEGNGNTLIQTLDSIGEIMALTRALQQEFEEVSLHKSHVKKDPVYRFWASRTRTKNRQILEDELNRRLRQQIFSLKGAQKELNGEIRQFRR